MSNAPPPAGLPALSPAPTLLLLPGLGCDEELFADQAAALRADGHRVHLSSAHQHEDHVEAMATRALAEVDGPLLPVAHSMGGMVAMAIARQAPQRLRGAVLIGTSARPDTPERSDLRRRASALFAAGRLDEVLGANAMLVFHAERLADRALVARYTAMVKRAGAEGLIRQNRAAMTRPDARPGLAAWAWPALVLVGEADQQTPPAITRELAEAIPGAVHEVLPGAGHLPTMEQPALVTARLRAWLALNAARG